MADLSIAPGGRAIDDSLFHPFFDLGRHLDSIHDHNNDVTATADDNGDSGDDDDDGDYYSDANSFISILVDGTTMHIASAHEMVKFPAGAKQVQPINLKSLDTSATGPMLSRGYTSDEEIASPLDHDDDDDRDSLASFPSESSGRPSIDDVLFPEHLAHSCAHIEQQCAEAQAITYVRPGRAKVVVMSKRNSCPPVAARTTAPRPVSGTALSIFRSRAHTQGEQTLSRNAASRDDDDNDHTTATPSSGDASVDSSPATNSSSAESSAKEKRPSRRRPSLPPLKIMSGFHARSPKSPSPVREPAATMDKADFLKHDPYSTSASGPGTVPRGGSTPTTQQQQQPRSSKPKISTPLHIRGKSIGFLRRNAPGDSSKEASSESGSGSRSDSSSTPTTPRMPAPSSQRSGNSTTTQKSSAPTTPAAAAAAATAAGPRLVPRGANERQPIITLPPSPQQANDLSTDAFPPLGLNDRPNFPPRSDSVPHVGAVSAVDLVSRKPIAFKRDAARRVSMAAS